MCPSFVHAYNYKCMHQDMCFKDRNKLNDIVDSSFIYLVLLNGFVNQCCDPSNCCCTNHHCDSYDQNASYAYNITEK